MSCKQGVTKTILMFDICGQRNQSFVMIFASNILKKLDCFFFLETIFITLSESSASILHFHNYEFLPPANSEKHINVQ